MFLSEQKRSGENACARGGRVVTFQEIPVSVSPSPPKRQHIHRIYTKAPLPPSHFASLPSYRAIRLISQIAPLEEEKSRRPIGIVSWSCFLLHGEYSDFILIFIIHLFDHFAWDFHLVELQLHIQYINTITYFLICN